MTTPEKKRNLIRRIQALFNLGKDPEKNPMEAAEAIAKAKKLMEKFNIEEAELNGTECDFIEMDFEMYKNSAEASLVLAVWIGKAFFCRILRKPHPTKKRQDVVRFIGTKTDVAASSFIYGYMMDLIETNSDDYFQTVRSKQDVWTPVEVKKVKATYAIGFAHAVMEKLKEIDEANKAAEKAKEESGVSDALSIDCKAVALIKNDLIQKYMDEHHPDVEERGGEKEEVDPNHYRAGYIRGEKAGIFRGVAGKASKKREIGN